MAGKLYIVSTPIGNLEDITLRAIRTLGEVDLIAAEDTRRTKILLNHYQIRAKLISYHEHNKVLRGKWLITQLKKGKDVALVSDAGTPGISDPGEYLVRLAWKDSINIIPIPGASAVITALSISGFPASRFVFEGFLPHKKTQRRKSLESLKDEKRTLIFYESPHRLLASLKDIFDIYGDREILVGRELTKLYEEIIRRPISEVIQEFENRKIKGEITLLISGSQG